MPVKKKPSPHNSEIIYVLRTAQQHHVQLSFMADQKANIIIGSFLVYCTIMFTYIFKNNYWHIAFIPLSLSFLSSFILALMVLLPSLNRVKSKSPNLLFFQGFGGMSEEDYIAEMVHLLDKESVPRQMLLKDIYLLGRVLKKKYYKLRISYFVLLGGILISIITFAVGKSS